jgi:LAO/AO transport system kinase
MDAHVGDESVFIRSIATRGKMGGLARVVPQAIDLLDVAGFRVAIVETVGVGQVEVDIADEADTTVVVLNPGWGDWLQANKAGLLEVADILVMNKADRPQVKEAVRDLERMLDDSEAGPWRPPVVTTVATTGEGIDHLWAQIEEHRSFLEKEGLLDARRRERRVRRLRRTVLLRVDAAVERRLSAPDAEAVAAAVGAGDLDPDEGADRLVEQMLGHLDLGLPGRGDGSADATEQT